MEKSGSAFGSAWPSLQLWVSSMSTHSTAGADVEVEVSSGLLCSVTVFFHLPVTTLQTFFVQTKMIKTQTPCEDKVSLMLHLVIRGYLAHVQGVGENHPTRIELQRGEGKVEDLKVPGDAHAKEESAVDHHLVPHHANLAAAPSCPAVAGAARAKIVG